MLLLSKNEFLPYINNIPTFAKTKSIFNIYITFNPTKLIFLYVYNALILGKFFSFYFFVLLKKVYQQFLKKIFNY